MIFSQNHFSKFTRYCVLSELKFDQSLEETTTLFYCIGNNEVATCMSVVFDANVKELAF